MHKRRSAFGNDSAVVGFEHLDSDSDLLRSLLWNCVRDEGAHDGTPFDRLRSDRLDLRRRNLVSSARLPGAVHSTVVGPPRGLVRRHVAACHRTGPRLEELGRSARIEDCLLHLHLHRSLLHSHSCHDHRLLHGDLDAVVK